MTTRGGGIRALRPSYSVLIGKLLSVLGDGTRVRVAKIYAMVLYIHCGVCLYITYLCEFSYLLVCIMFFFSVCFAAVQLSERSGRRRNLRADNGRTAIRAGRRRGSPTAARASDHGRLQAACRRTTTVSGLYIVYLYF